MTAPRVAQTAALEVLVAMNMSTEATNNYCTDFDMNNFTVRYKNWSEFKLDNMKLKLREFIPREILANAQTNLRADAKKWSDTMGICFDNSKT